MKWLITFLGFSFLLIQVAAASGEERLLARVTVYWRGEGSGQRASSNGVLLRDGHCAVDPKKIPFGSRVVFDDICCVAVDSGPDVINRKAARACGQNARERSALVIDRFFDTKGEAMAWAAKHPHFMNVWIVPSGSPVPQKPSLRLAAVDQNKASSTPAPVAPPQKQSTVATAANTPLQHHARRRS